MSSHEEIFKNVVATYDKATGYLYIYDDETGEQLEKQKKRPYLSAEEKAVADKAAKLIARDYGETLRRLGNE